jgi:hypothetical protein
MAGLPPVPPASASAADDAWCRESPATRPVTLFRTGSCLQDKGALTGRFPAWFLPQSFMIRGVVTGPARQEADLNRRYGVKPAYGRK